MSKTWSYDENKKRIIIDPPKQRLRITGHRIASVLGLNKYQTPFGAWAEITKLAKLPFEGNKYTEAGKAIEPKLIEYLSKKLPNVVSIEEYYGNSFPEYAYNNFKDESSVFGGIIDAVSTLNDKKTITAIIECKTSSKPQEWRNGNVPVEYLLQGALYSYLKGLDRVVFICTFLQPEDYNHPENYVVTDENTVITIKKLKDLIFEVNGQYVTIAHCMRLCEEWWETYIESGNSPDFDEKLDKEYLDIIRATDETQDNKLIDVCEKAINLHRDIEELKEKSGIKAMEKELKVLETSIKNKMIEDETSVCGDYKLTKKTVSKFDEKRFAENNPKLYDSYCETSESYTLTKNRKKDEE